MAVHQGRSTSCSNQEVLKTGLVLIAMCLSAYLFGPPLYWHLREGLAALTHSSSSYSLSCPRCDCDCSSHPLLSIPEGLSNTSFTDCAQRDPDVDEETEKNFANLLSEGLKALEDEAVNNQQHADIKLLEAKKLTSQYQKEADKCNSGMATCEEAREKAEMALLLQKKFTALWKQRARRKGYKEGSVKANVHSQGNLQSI